VTARSPLRISEAASLALHAAGLMADAGERKLTAKSMSEGLGVSEAHLAKVLARLVRAGLVTSVRGPRGGFTLAKRANAISLLDVYEAVEGGLERPSCLLGVPVCGRRNCLVSDLLGRLAKEIEVTLRRTTLAEFRIESAGCA
jgi:Rrf2 family protein